MTIHVGLTLSPSEDLRAAALPLLEEEIVDAIEWPIDMGFGGVPGWCEALLELYGDEGRLVGHGVELSLLTAGQDRRRARWLADVEQAFATWEMQHLSEHFGFMTAGAMVGGTPLPHPFTTSAVGVGVARLEELRARLGVPVGLENLALALGPDDVDAQPDFLEALLAPVDGFLLLDLHNLLCQAENFGRDPVALLARYPLHRVRQVHLAGGTHYRARSGAPLRRDDHESRVPEACLALLEEALTRCPDLAYVFLEYADNALRDAAEVHAFQETFRRVRALVADPPPAEAPVFEPSCAPAEDDPDALDAAQASFLEALDDAPTPAAARAALERHPWSAWARGFDPRALELAHHLVQRWGERRDEPSPGHVRAAVLESVGRVAWRRRRLPEPGPGQARVRVHACGLCGTDVQLWRGRARAPLPLVLGHEVVGEVEAVGEGVALAIGALVGVPWAQAGCGACAPCARGRWRFCERLVTWMRLGGGLADAVLADAGGCVPLGDVADPALLAPLLCAGYTVESALARAGVRGGERVAVLGIGGLGHLALQIADGEVFALTANPTKRGDAIELGADEVIVSEHPLGALAKAGGADVILVTSPTLDLGAAIAALRPEGRLVLAGAGDTAAMSSRALIEKGATVIGALPGPRAELRAVVERFARRELRPRVERYPLGQLRRVLHRLEDRRVRYRAVLVP